MKKIVPILIHVLFVSFIGFNECIAQNGYIPDDPDYINSLPELVLTPISDGINLPSEVDNSEFNYFPDKLYDQDTTGSCASASSVYYAFTYEINRLRGLSSNIIDNKYPPNFVWNFLNHGDYSTGLIFEKTWEVVKQSGCPNAKIWGNLNPLDYYRWMTGNEDYHSGLHNRMESYWGIDVGNPVGMG